MNRTEVESRIQSLKIKNEEINITCRSDKVKQRINSIVTSNNTDMKTERLEIIMDKVNRNMKTVLRIIHQVLKCCK